MTTKETIRASLTRVTAHLAREHGVKQDEIISEMYLYSLEMITP